MTVELLLYLYKHGIPLRHDTMLKVRVFFDYRVHLYEFFGRAVRISRVSCKQRILLRLYIYIIFCRFVLPEHFL